MAKVIRSGSLFRQGGTVFDLSKISCVMYVKNPSTEAALLHVWVSGTGGDPFKFQDDDASVLFDALMEALNLADAEDSSI